MVHVSLDASQLDRLQKNLQEISGTHSYSFKEIFPDDFMRKYTKYMSVSDFFEATGFKLDSQEDFKNLDETALDKFVSENSDFDSWGSMKRTASAELLEKKIQP